MNCVLLFVVNISPLGLILVLAIMVVLFYVALSSDNNDIPKVDDDDEDEDDDDEDQKILPIDPSNLKIKRELVEYE